MNSRRLCHFHVPKTGGTALRKALVQALGPQRCFPPEPDAAARYNGARHFRALSSDQRARIMLVSGHFTLDDLPMLDGFRACAVLREPRERAVSVVRHFMRNDPRHAGHSFREVLEAISPAQVHDFYHRRFSGSRYDPAHPSTDLALEGLGRIEFLGLFDQLDPFAKKVAREVFGRDIAIQRLNVAPPAPALEAADQAAIDELTQRDAALFEIVSRDARIKVRTPWMHVRDRYRQIFRIAAP